MKELLRELYKFYDFCRIFIVPICTFVLSLFGIVLSNLERYRKEHKQLYWVAFLDFIERDGLNFLVGSAFLFLLLSLLDGPFRKKHARLLKEMDEEKEKNAKIVVNIKKYFGEELREISKKFNFQPADQSRLSLYVHDQQSSFALWGRYSPNPKYNKPGRPVYSDSTGCIGRAWTSDWCFDNNGSSYGMSEKECANLEMQSAVYAAKRIATHKDPVGVIVIESVDRRRFEEAGARKILSSLEVELAEKISVLCAHIPHFAPPVKGRKKKRRRGWSLFRFWKRPEPALNGNSLEEAALEKPAA